MNTVRMAVLFIFTLLLIIVLGIILSATVIRNVQVERRLNAGTLLRVYVQQVDSAMTRIASRMDLEAMKNLDFIYLTRGGIDKDTSYYEQMQNIVNLSKDLGEITDDNTFVSGVFACFPSIDQIVLSDTDSSFSDSKEEFSAYIKSCCSEDSVERLSVWRVIWLNGKSYLFRISRRQQAYYGAWFELSALYRRLGLNKEEQVRLLFADDKGELLYEKGGEETLGRIDLERNQAEVDGGWREVVWAGSENSPLCMVQIMSGEGIIHTVPLLLRVVLVALVFYILSIPVMIYCMWKWVVRPAGKLNGAMERIRKGDMEFRIEETGSDSEFDRLNHEFNRMMDDIEKLQTDILEGQLKEQRIRMRFLSQQIQPHFILNTLNIIYSYEPEDYALIQQMILNLSRYFRYIVNANEDEVPLREEMEHIRNYFEIQKVRYPGFAAIVEYEEEVAGCRIPPLLVQNFAENSIKHYLRSGGEIQIYVIARRYEGDKLQIQMLDTGKGIDEGVLEKIEEFRHTGIRQKGLGIGIQNAIERLQILYGVDVSFEIMRDEPHGTRIKLLLPWKQGEDDDDEED